MLMLLPNSHRDVLVLTVCQGSYERVEERHVLPGGNKCCSELSDNALVGIPKPKRVCRNGSWFPSGVTSVAFYGADEYRGVVDGAVDKQYSWTQPSRTSTTTSTPSQVELFFDVANITATREPTISLTSRNWSNSPGASSCAVGVSQRNGNEFFIAEIYQ